MVLLETLELDRVVTVGSMSKLPLINSAAVGRSLLLGAVATAMTLQGCSSVAAPNPETTLAAAPQPANAAPSVSHGTDDSYLATGPIIVENQVEVLAQREGMLKQILVDVGGTVHKGTPLALLDDTELQARRDAAEAKVHSSEADLKDWQAETRVAEVDLRRAEDMGKAGISTQEQVDHARYKFEGSQYEVEKAQRNVENAKAELHIAEVELGKTRIEAPFSGVVARRYVHIGQKVAAGDRLFWVSELAPLRVKFTVPEKFMGEIKQGANVYVTSDLSPGNIYSAKVLQVSPVVDPASDSVDVMAQLEGTPAQLRPGMTAHISLSPSSKPR